MRSRCLINNGSIEKYGLFKFLEMSKKTEYVIIFLIIIISDLLWYNFTKPPIVENYTLDLQPLRIIFMSFYPFNNYSWPGTTFPTIFNFPFNLFYGGLFYITGGNYAVSFFIPNFFIQFLGALSLYKITRVFLSHYKINKIYAFYSVFLYAFNAEIIVGGLWANGLFDLGTAFLPILIYISYLAIFKSKRYYLLLIFASFYLFYSFPGGYPNGAIILAEEFIISVIILSLIFALTFKISFVKKIGLFVKTILINVLAVIIGNLYLLVPTIKIIPLYLAVAQNPENYFAFGVGWDSVDYIQNTVRLLNTWVINSLSLIPPWEATYLSSGIVLTLLYLPFTLAALSVIFTRKRWYLAIYSLFLIVIFLSKANHAPFGFVFTWLVNNFVLFYPFYNGAAFYPLQIMFYGIFGSLTLYSITIYIEKFLMLVKKKVKPKKLLLSKGHALYTKLFVFLVIILLILISVYPIVFGDLSIGTQEQPAGVYLPPEYKDLNSFLSAHNSPVLVLPGTNVFNLNRYNNYSWYGGGDIYPNLLPSPSRSSMYPVLGPAISGSLPYNALSTIYGLPNYAPVNYSSDMLSLFSNGSIFRVITPGANIAYLTNSNSELSVSYNYSAATNPSGVLISEIFAEPYDISNFTFLIVNFTDKNVNFSNIQIGLSFLGNQSKFIGPGYWYFVGEENGIYSSFIKENEYNYSAIIQIRYPAQTAGQVNLNQLTAITIRVTPGQTGHGYLNLSSVKFSMGNKSIESKIFANDMAIMGFKYVLVDSSIQDTPYTFRTGDYYNLLLTGSPYFEKIFTKGPLTLYENLNFNGIFSIGNTILFSNSRSILSDTFDNQSINNSVTFIDNRSMFYSSENILPSRAEVSYKEVSPTEYTLNISSNDSFLLVFKETFNKNFFAKTSNGTPLKDHFLVNGYANGWIVPKNVKSLTIYYKGSEVYRYTELSLVMVPFFFLCFFLISETKRSYVIGRKKGAGKSV
jgi:hypothetical protein